MAQSIWHIKFIITDSHFIITEESIYQEDVAILNVYTPNNRCLKHTKQKLTEIKGEIDKSMIVVGDFNTPMINVLLCLYQHYLQ